MPVWLQVWIVIVTIGLVAIALFALATIKRFLDRASSDLSQLTQTVRGTASRVDRLVDEGSTLLTDVRGTMKPIEHVTRGVAAIGQRVVDLSSSLLDEVEAPLHTATALVRGVRTGTGHLMNRFMHRFTHRSTRNGGEVNER